MSSSNDYLFILGNYQLIEVLGIGAMGYVYRARQMNLDRDVAVKMLAPKLAQEIGYNDLFIREARTAASLEHPHIVPVFDYGVEQNISYVAMRLLLGGSLGERVQYRLDRHLALPSLVDTSSILMQAASALDYAHARGVIHRDIKPTNLMFDQHGVVYIVDFGIAKLVGTTGSMRGGTFLGTPSFMAPEQWQGLNPTPAVDQYALGAVIYMMLTGHPPFESDTALALMVKHLNDTPRPVESYRSGVSSRINPILQRALAKQPEDRFPNVMAFAQAFAAVVRETATVAEAPTEFTTYALPQASFTLPFPTPTKLPTIPPSMEATPVITTAPRDTFGRGRSLILWIESLLLLLAIMLIVLLISQRSSQDAPTPTVAAAFVSTLPASPTLPDDPASPTAIDSKIPPGQAGLTFTTTAEATSSVLLADVIASATPTPTSTETFTATFTSTATPSPTDSPTFTPTATATFTSTATPSPTDSPTFTPTATATFTATFTATTTPSPTNSATFTPTSTATATLGSTNTPTSTPTITETFTATATVTATPSATPTPTVTETATVTATPTGASAQPRPNVPWHFGSHLRVNNPNGAWLRARASTRAAQVATLAYNNLVTATGNHYFDGRQWWWEVTASWGAVGWVEQYSLVEQ